ncbi:MULTISPECIES: FAD-dependent oxidoreductase [Micrococcaceae]|jgi:glycine/D-amino acid oxidase-like deaminating enzyme/nitrite reductase/ring-hydroxylating ferredoxin subunit|uniref:FAD-dependent oxidoreductase n=1 Tax=Paenarthrobacter nicotinovorans TaxID=29320 RepID=UPI000361B9A0|nr:FAD-dependent oxidoreductase [Arthrobacter sp. NtRootA2]BCW15057.1 FAD-dependent oxidoreductase [Arthrobacter sp. NtRootA4]BCW23392.1 FAD-dependent oxidoreductase [Arthrobacter sp. NtRootC7]BCW27660.1 FAD-dependent oxidoreductase [Arthrobacter sp. NtRootC45]BCW31928.1 FAD-dependent oxidoreductase [Arthrobacter sp. NtRootD5]
MKSLWLDRESRFTSDAVPEEKHFDTIVVGAGLTGMVAALLLSRSGQRVVVFEARTLGAVTTGNTTGKVSLLQGGALSALRGQYPLKVVRAYVEANKTGQAWLTQYMEQQGVPFQRRTAVTFATTDDGGQRLRKEAAVSRDAGLDVHFSRDPGLPFPVVEALELEDQAQIHPMDVLETLASDIREHGGLIVEGVQVRNVGSELPLGVSTSRGTFTADTVVVATGTPILDRGLYFAKLEPNRSYAAALRMPGHIPQGMYLSIDAPTRSQRTYPAPDGELLLVGGYGHTAGRAMSPQSHLDDLLGWANQHYPGAEVTHRWSAQDYQATNLMPFFGKLPRGRGRIFFGTGYNKWGMSNGVAAALSITSDILGGQSDWATTIHHRVTSPQGALQAVRLNASTAKRMIEDKAKVRKNPEITDETHPPEGTGVVGLYKGEPAAVSTVDGKVCMVSASCAHLGGLLTWNDAEKSWDCPLHGSRFTPEGTYLEGPATHDLDKTVGKKAKD